MRCNYNTISRNTFLIADCLPWHVVGTVLTCPGHKCVKHGPSLGAVSGRLAAALCQSSAVGAVPCGPVPVYGQPLDCLHPA